MLESYKEAKQQLAATRNAVAAGRAANPIYNQVVDVISLPLPTVYCGRRAKSLQRIADDLRLVGRSKRKESIFDDRPNDAGRLLTYALRLKAFDSNDPLMRAQFRTVTESLRYVDDGPSYGQFFHRAMAVWAPIKIADVGDISLDQRFEIGCDTLSDLIRGYADPAVDENDIAFWPPKLCLDYLLLKRIEGREIYTVFEAVRKKLPFIQTRKVGKATCFYRIHLWAVRKLLERKSTDEADFSDAFRALLAAPTARELEQLQADIEFFDF
jgi:hypothetical protein